MRLIRVMLMFAALSCAVDVTTVMAETAPVPVVLNKHLGKLLGTWTSAQGDVTFNANSTIIYQGHKYFCAIAQGTIQISKKKLSLILPYRFLDEKLLITDGGEVTTYTRVP